MLFNRPARSFQRAQTKVRLLTLRMQLHLYCERDRPMADIHACSGEFPIRAQAGNSGTAEIDQRHSCAPAASLFYIIGSAQRVWFPIFCYHAGEWVALRFSPGFEYDI